MISELIWILPFVLLLGCIAVLPLVRKHWWENNFMKVSAGLAAIIVLRYLFFLNAGETLVHTGFEYFSFIVLIGSLFIISGGIHIQVKGEADPLVNCAFLLTGAILANFLGTTGASMILIRPWLRMNKHRLKPYHVVFFIFLISNIGGGLTPMGDPPLFLGYLKGVPFFWVLRNVWPIWLTALGLLLLIFAVFDYLDFKKAPLKLQKEETLREEEWRLSGGHHILFLALVIGAVFLNHPPFLREALMIAACVISYKTTSKKIHEANAFNLGPIKEVAILFAGIFATMIPALEWLEHHAAELGIQAPAQFFWGSGILSSVLDNAPTYLNFLSASVGLLHPAPEGVTPSAVKYILINHPDYIRAISAGSVFFGAVTYIGNGPNFLVKSIADQTKVKTPGFFAYFFQYSLLILIPIFALIGMIFF